MTDVSIRQIPISRVVIAEDEIDAVVEALRSGELRQGAQVHAFEEEFAQRVGAKHAIAVNSGTAALHTVYAALFAPGDEVLVPAFTFFATASMLLAVGAVPVFCDIDPETLQIDVSDARARITPRTRGIVPVHLFGNAADIPALLALALEHDFRIVWDAAQAHDTLYDQQPVGGLPDAVCYSFYPTKNMTTGEGGMICTPSDSLAARLRLIRSQGEARKYEHVTLGFNFRLTDFQAALGRKQLEKLSAWTAQRRENARYLIEALADLPGIAPQRTTPRATHAYHQLTFVLGDAHDRDTVVHALQDRGVGCMVYYPIPLHQQPIFSQHGGAQRLPASESAAARVFSVPVHPNLSGEELACIADSLRAVLRF